MEVNIHHLREAFDATIDGFVEIGVLNADGSFNTPTTAQDIKLAVFAEQLAQKFGVVVPAKIDALIKALPLIIAFVG